MKATVAAFKGLAAFDRRSLLFRKKHQQAQLSTGLVAEGRKPLALIVAGETRWDGEYHSCVESMRRRAPRGGLAPE